jgi:hypothetical protein
MPPHGSSSEIEMSSVNGSDGQKKEKTPAERQLEDQIALAKSVSVLKGFDDSVGLDSLPQFVRSSLPP